MTEIRQSIHDPEDTELAPHFKVRDYLRARDAQPPNRVAIAQALRARFVDRYIEPVETKKRGFTMMAIACLTIEAFQSFVRGWASTNRQSELAFCSFFDRFDAFAEMRGHASAFYRHIRCGIVHQAETTGGWRIRRDSSPLVDAAARTVNAEVFLARLKTVIDDFCLRLEGEPWDGSDWQNVVKKMNSIVRSCRPSD